MDLTTCFLLIFNALIWSTLFLLHVDFRHHPIRSTRRMGPGKSKPQEPHSKLWKS